MKMMEILKMRMDCLLITKPNERTLPEPGLAINLSNAAQEYYTSGLFAQDTLEEMRNANTHPYIYDGTPHLYKGEAQIIQRYHLAPGMRFALFDLTHALHNDIQNKNVKPDGSIDFQSMDWIGAAVLKVPHDNILPYNRLPYVLAKMLAERTR